MAKETLGYMKLEWTCPRCNSRNPGPQKTCLSCGAPQPENVAFQLPEKQALMQDEQEIAQAKKGADIHCPYCGARNPADAELCAQCGGDLRAGKQRESGRVMGAFDPQTAPQTILCPRCATENDLQALKCASCGAPLTGRLSLEPVAAKSRSFTPGLWIGVGLLFILVACVGFFVLASRSKEVEATLREAYWETSLVVEGLRPVERSNWREEIPVEATILSCQPKVHHTQEEAVPNANKICGTPYTVDTGSGYAEVVQDCVYEVLMDYCTYSTLEWQVVETLSQQGKSLPVIYPSTDLTDDQRLGEQQVTYVCIFEGSQRDYRFTTSDENFYRQCVAESQWVLEVNTLGQVISAKRK
jgi:ribosomal protein L40E